MRGSFKRILFWLIPILLVGWVMSTFQFRETGELLQRISYSQISLLILINCMIFLLFALRWWILIRSAGTRISFRDVARYRLTAFGINYFTPGPQFGGEPYQVFALTRKSGSSHEVAVSSVTLDKLIELIANFSFLTVGLGAILLGGFLPRMLNLVVLIVVGLLLLLPMVYLCLIRLGKAPLRAILGQVGGSVLLQRVVKRGMPWVVTLECNLQRFLREQPLIFGVGLLLAFLTWAAVIAEYRLALGFLDLQLSLGQTVVVMTAARLAFLLPSPSGLGLLEASQIVAMQTLGFTPTAGIGISLLIRARDVVFGLTGLLLAGRISWRLDSS